jgi:serine/threonine-protein kinase RsbW
MSLESGLKPNNNESFNGDNWALPSREELLEGARKAFEDRLIKAGWGEKEEYLYPLTLAFDEFLTDAMKHGNKFDPNKKVFVIFNISKEKVSVTIRDEGEGFDPNTVPPVETEGEGFAKGSGRGLAMVNMFPDLVTFTHNEKGNEVTIETK